MRQRRAPNKARCLLRTCFCFGADSSGEIAFLMLRVNSTSTLSRRIDVLVVVVIAPRPEDVDGLRHETMHNSGRCCGSGRTCYGAGRMSKALRTGVGFGLKVGPRQAQREKGSSPTLLICLGWSVRCVPSAELAKTNL